MLALLSQSWPGRFALLVAACAAAGCHEPTAPQKEAGPPAEAVRHAVTYRTPAGAPRVPTGTLDEKGQPVTVACATCHTTKAVNAAAKLGTPLTAFHQGMTGQHGALTCVSCHNAAEGFGSLRLADGRNVAYTDVMTLCAQCHGPQFRDYQHGAHGGMTGHWDLTAGGRTRNVCTACHDPHAPKYPLVFPATGPNDRFLKGAGHE